MSDTDKTAVTDQEVFDHLVRWAKSKEGREFIVILKDGQFARCHTNLSGPRELADLLAATFDRLDLPAVAEGN